MKPMWMVRAGEKALFIDEFRDISIVAIGWRKAGDVSEMDKQIDVLEHVKKTWPEWNSGKQIISASQVYRFAHEIAVGDKVISYDPQTRTYILGEILGEYTYDPAASEELPHIRKVDWQATVDRDALSVRTKNSLGAISTLFRVPEDAAREIETLAHGGAVVPEDLEQEDEAGIALLEDIEGRAVEFIKDRISSLDWDEMQELVAGLLRAMGYKTRISPTGPDRGKDIVASPDGFGFENPRIVVEVKHRKETMGSAAIRSFLGGRHKDDKGLYVSTGGFSKDAYYEAERANIPLSLLNLDGLVESLLEYYDQIEPEIQRLVPLKKVYWPV